MTRIRNKASYSSLTEIINALQCNEHSECTWVGKDYSKAQLIEDLTEVKNISKMFLDNPVGKNREKLKKSVL